MLIYIPFIFFLTLTIYFWKKKGYIDVGVFLFAEYTLTSFFALLCVKLNLLGNGGILFTNATLQLNIIPTLLYCTLISAVIIPITRLDFSKFSHIDIVNHHIFDIFTYVLMCVALLNIYIIGDGLVEAIKSGDWAAIRSAHYSGELNAGVIKSQSLPKILGYFYYFNRTTPLALPCFFYSICFLNKSRLYNICLLLTSISVPLAGVLNADRTQFVLYTQELLICFFLFRQHIKQEHLKKLKVLFYPLITIVIMYLSAVTISRFAEREDGATGGAIQYAGQSYLNFCYFYEHANNDHIYTNRILPLTNHFINSELDYSEEIRDIKSDEQGFYVGVFSTFLGDILLDVGMTGLIIWVLAFITFITCIVINTDNFLTFGHILCLYILIVIPAFGIFYYPYYLYTNGICIVVALCMSILFHFRFKFK